MLSKWPWSSFAHLREHWKFSIMAAASLSALASATVDLIRNQSSSGKLSSQIVKIEISDQIIMNLKCWLADCYKMLTTNIVYTSPCIYMDSPLRQVRLDMNKRFTVPLSSDWSSYYHSATLLQTIVMALNPDPILLSHYFLFMLL